VEEIFATVEAHAAHMNYVNVSTAWHRLASLCRRSVRATGGLPTSAATATAAAASAAVRADPRLRLLEAATLAAVPSYSAQNISNTLWGAAGLLHMPPPPLLRALTAAARRSLGAFSPHALANTAWAAATLRWPGADALVAAVARASDDRLDEFAPQGLSNLLWACASCGVHPGDALCDVIARRVAAAPDTFKAQELSTAAWAWAQLRHHPGRRALAALDAQLAARLPEFAPQAISNVLWAAAILQHRPEKALAAIGDAFAAPPAAAATSSPRDARSEADEATAALAALPQGFCTQDLANLAWSLALLDAFALPLFGSVWAVARALPPESYASEGLRMLFQTVLLAHADAARGGRAGAACGGVALPPALAAAAEASWRSQVGVNTVSELHGAVCRALAALRIPHAVERLSDDGLFSVDVALEVPSSSRRIALEVDGPYHFSANSRARLGPTRGRDALLAARGWEVLSVPFFEWGTLRNVYEQKLYLRSKLAAIRVDADAMATGGAAGAPTPWATLGGDAAGGGGAAMTAAPGACARAVPGAWLCGCAPGVCLLTLL
jgi:hypothetical protein